MRAKQPYQKLTAAEAAHWRAIVKSLPADHLSPADLPMLSAFCCAAARHDRAILELAGRIDDPSLLLVVDRCIKQMASLATKLRLCANSRIRPETAGRNAAHAVDRDPWEGYKHSPDLQ